MQEQHQLYRYRYNGINYRNMKDLCLNEGISKSKFSFLVKNRYVKKYDNQLNIADYGSGKTSS